MVQLFYFNGELYHTTEGREKAERGVCVLPHTDFHTRFNGKHIHITEHIVRNALEVPSYPDGPAQIRGNFDYVAACKVLFDDDSLTTRVRVTTNLPHHLRILHFIVCQNLNPRNGKFTDLTKRDSIWMYQIIIKNPPRLDSMFMWKMRDVIAKNKQEYCIEGLLYGKLVHTLLGKLNISPMVYMPLVGITLEKFTMKSLKQMHYAFNCNTKKWEKTEHGRVQERQPNEGTSGGNVDIEMVMNGRNELRVRMD